MQHNCKNTSLAVKSTFTNSLFLLKKNSLSTSPLQFLSDQQFIISTYRVLLLKPRDWTETFVHKSAVLQAKTSIILNKFFQLHLCAWLLEIQVAMKHTQPLQAKVKHVIKFKIIAQFRIKYRPHCYKTVCRETLTQLIPVYGE